MLGMVIWTTVETHIVSECEVDQALLRVEPAMQEQLLTLIPCNLQGSLQIMSSCITQ